MSEHLDDLPEAVDIIEKRGPLNPFVFGTLSVFIGIFTGLGAVVFRGMIAVFHNLFFLGKFSVFYNANSHTLPSTWGPFVILVPVAGALGVVFLVKNFAPEAKGHGVPEVMDAIYYNKGIIRPVVVVIKSLASALSIGTGGSVGREGPIIQIGSAFGSTVGQLLRIPPWQRITLIAAGAGGGIAATFNTPIGGVLFAMEIMMHEVSVRTLVPVAICTATATYTGRFFFGNHPSFVIPNFQAPYFHLTTPIVLPSYIILGLLMGVASAIYIRSIYLFEDFFEEHVKLGDYGRHAIGMLVVGGIIYGMMVYFGHYYVEGVGYATIQDMLTNSFSSPYFLLALFVLKLFVTSMTLGSGASGGIFSPALFMGSVLGGAYGIFIHHLFPSIDIYPPAFAVAGMAGMVGGATGSALAAIVMIFEMTLDYNVIIPMTITVALSYGLRRVLSKQSIYTLKLERRGHYMPEAMRADFHLLQRARDIMDRNFAVLASARNLDDLAQIAEEQPDISWFLIEDGGRVKGFVTKEAARSPMFPITLGEIADNRYVTVTDETPLIEVMDSMRLERVAVAMITDDPTSMAAGNVKGIITKHQIGNTMAQAVELYSDHRER
jgi:chloride channel protein, CIC family